MKLSFQLKRMGIYFYHRFRVFFPQFFAVAKQDQRMAHVEIVGQRRVIAGSLRRKSSAPLRNPRWWSEKIIILAVLISIECGMLQCLLIDLFKTFANPFDKFRSGHFSHFCLIPFCAASEFLKGSGQQASKT